MRYHPFNVGNTGTSYSRGFEVVLPEIDSTTSLAIEQIARQANEMRAAIKDMIPRANVERIKTTKLIWKN